MPPSPAGPKTEMGFVTLKSGDRKETDKIAGRWSDQMSTAGIDVRGYTIEDNRILFVCDQRGYKDMNRVRNFVLKQIEVVDFEWNSKKSVPGDVLSEEEEGNSGKPAAVADPIAQFQAMQDEQAARQKREQRRAKKEKEARLKKKKTEKAKKQKAKEAADKKRAQQQKVAEAAAARKQADAQAAAIAEAQTRQQEQQQTQQEQLKQEL